MPSAPPNSELVSEIAEAAPARSCGASPTIKSVASVKTGEMPSETIVVAGTTIARPGASAGLREERKPDRGRAESRRRGRTRGEIRLREDRRRQRADDEGDRGGHGPEAGHERRQPEHQLQVLRHEDEHAEDDEGREQVGAERYAEGGEPKEPEIDHRVRESQAGDGRRRCRRRGRRGWRARRALQIHPARSASGHRSPRARRRATGPR